ncbi:hypothetical protein BJ165DRAFT_1594684 [Panaeolus papilionaceus]|nr:hypothetical protein BJ165DRAFT_1594684 [Panaeolus papilionaceus]
MNICVCSVGSLWTQIGIDRESDLVDCLVDIVGTAHATTGAHSIEATFNTLYGQPDCAHIRRTPSTHNEIGGLAVQVASSVTLIAGKQSKAICNAIVCYSLGLARKTHLTSLGIIEKTNASIQVKGTVGISTVAISTDEIPTLLVHQPYNLLYGNLRSMNGKTSSDVDILSFRNGMKSYEDHKAPILRHSVEMPPA